MKKHFLPILILIFLTVGLMACAPADGDGEHTHKFSEWTTTSLPTCVAQGMQARTCSCGYSEYDAIPPLAHSEVPDAAAPASCEAKGKTAGSHCGVCNTVIVAQTDIPEIGHTPVTDPEILATCTTGGKTAGSHCGECDTVLVPQENTQPLQHAPSNISIIEEATCLESGTKRFSCTRQNCSYYYDEDYTLEEYSSTEIYNQALRYTGEIITYDKLGAPYAQGTGFVFSADGKIITNYHVIDGAYSATITIGEDTYDIQSVLAYDAEIDLAVLKVNASGLTPANVCKRDPVTAETVYAVGSPRGFTATISVGVVSYAKRVVNGVTYVQHDADITHGSSGGPLINKYGEVIGVNAGAFGNAEINVAVFAGELDRLTYGAPITLSELFELNYTPNEALTDWLVANFNFYGDTYISYEIVGADFIYSISYDLVYGYNYVDGYWVFDDGAILYVCVDLSATDGNYIYYAQYTDGVNQNIKNTTSGIIRAADYSAATNLTYTSYVGEYWNKDSLMQLYTSGIFNAMEWFAYCLDNYIPDLSLLDFGFSSLEYNYGEEP